MSRPPAFPVGGRTLWQTVAPSHTPPTGGVRVTGNHTAEELVQRTQSPHVYRQISPRLESHARQNLSGYFRSSYNERERRQSHKLFHQQKADPAMLFARCPIGKAWSGVNSPSDANCRGQIAACARICPPSLTT